MTAAVFKDEVKLNADYIEAGELANEIGKIYQKRLDKFIEGSAFLNYDILYFLVKTEKDPTNLKNIEIKMAATNRKFKYLKESTDFWEYDYRVHKKSLIWSVPHRIDMKNFLRAENKYSKDLIKWIKEYLKQNPDVNLNDKSQVILT